MDLLELLQILFCCMFPVRRRRRKAPRKTVVYRPSLLHRRPRRLDRHRRIAWLRTRANYADLRDQIVRGIVCDLSSTLVAWCPRKVVGSDFVAQLLHICGDVLLYLDRWRGSPGVWAGTVVQYATREEAARALKEVPMQCRHVQIFPLEHILCLLVDCELLHGAASGHHSSEVVVRGNHPPFSLLLELSSYGKVEKLLLCHQQPGVVCRASYPFVTQAYLATTLLDGSYHEGVRLTAALHPTPRDKEIVDDARKCLMFASEAYFPA